MSPRRPADPVRRSQRGRPAGSRTGTRRPTSCSRSATRASACRWSRAWRQDCPSSRSTPRARPTSARRPAGMRPAGCARRAGSRSTTRPSGRAACAAIPDVEDVARAAALGGRRTATRRARWAVAPRRGRTRSATSGTWGRRCSTRSSAHARTSRPLRREARAVGRPRERRSRRPLVHGGPGGSLRPARRHTRHRRRTWRSAVAARPARARPVRRRRAGARRSRPRGAPASPVVVTEHVVATMPQAWERAPTCWSRSTAQGAGAAARALAGQARRGDPARLPGLAGPRARRPSGRVRRAHRRPRPPSASRLPGACGPASAHR